MHACTRVARSKCTAHSHPLRNFLAQSLLARPCVHRHFVHHRFDKTIHCITGYSSLWPFAFFSFIRYNNYTLAAGITTDETSINPLQAGTRKNTFCKCKRRPFPARGQCRRGRSSMKLVGAAGRVRQRQAAAAPFPRPASLLVLFSLCPLPFVETHVFVFRDRSILLLCARCLLRPSGCPPARPSWRSPGGSSPSRSRPGCRRT